MYLHQGNYYLIIEGSVFKDRRTNKLFEFSSVKKIKRKSDGSVAGYLFYYTIKDRNKANSFVMGFDKNLKALYLPLSSAFSTLPCPVRTMHGRFGCKFLSRF